MPHSIRELHNLVFALPPQLNRSWSWELAAAYRLLITTVMVAHAQPDVSR